MSCLAVQRERPENHSARIARAPSHLPHSFKRRSLHRHRHALAEAGTVNHGVDEHTPHAQAGAAENRVGGEQDDLALRFAGARGGVGDALVRFRPQQAAQAQV
jgi:hypothetical protein